MRKRGRSNKSKYLLGSVVLSVVVIALALGYLYRPNQNQNQKPPASQYLKVANTKSIGEFSNQNKTVLIKTLGLNITAVGGDATSIVVQVASQVDPTNDVWAFLAKGASQEAQIRLNGYMTVLNDQGKFPVEVDIGCSEATHEAIPITLYLDPKDIVHV